MDYLIALNGWAASQRAEFRWKAGTEFFQQFDNQEILDADITIDAVAVKTGHSMDIDLDVRGHVKVRCDRCLGDLVLPVETEALLTLRPDGEDSTEGEREIIVPDASATEMDFRQVIYDYVCLSLPMQRVHPEGECDPDTVSFLSRGVEDEEAASSSPFAALKGLF